MDSIDIWRAARLLLDQHGVFAEDRARNRMMDLVAARDIEGYATWKQILAAVEELQRTKLRDGGRTQ